MTLGTSESSLRNRSLGEIAASLPGAQALFRQLKLEFCCRGEETLAAAAVRRDLDLAAVERALEALKGSPANTGHPQDTAGLIRHILSRYHATHRRELAELVALARKVEAVHAAHPKAPQGLASLLTEMAGDLEVHMKKEELILFPAMLRFSFGALGAPIFRMRHDHREQGESLRRLEEITAEFGPPEDACRSWQSLYAGVEKLVEDLVQHIHLENNVLFPRFEREAAD